MIRVTIDRDSRRIGSMWIHGVELELHAVDETAYFEALNGREHARTLATSAAVCAGCADGTLDNHIYGHGQEQSHAEAD